MDALIWTPQQAAALDSVGRWLRDPHSPQVYRLFGFAGTGKTTLAKYLAEQETGTVRFAAFTGKAASVLRERGCDNATTLHALLYHPGARDPVAVQRAKELLEHTPAHHTDYAERMADFVAARAAYQRPRFTHNPDSVLKQARLLVLDEVSMVGKALANDVLAVTRKVLVLGDPGQLPPIEGTGYFTEGKPDSMLTDITRQAADSPIIRWATMVREGRSIPAGALDGTARKMSKKMVDDQWLTTHAGQLVCGRNDSRAKLNRRIRHHLGYGDRLPQQGDVLVCLRNNHQLGLLNGVLCTAHRDAVPMDEEALSLTIRYEGELRHDLLVDSAPFTSARKDPLAFAPASVPLCQFDYGYAITVHKAQGSQWSGVTIWDDGFGKWEPKLRQQWLYTGITRASQRLTILAGA